MIALHPEPGASASEVRWVVPGGVPALGRVIDAPGLGDLLRDGALASVTACADCVLTVAAPGRDWADIGGRVRTALATALASPRDWAVEPLDVDEDALAAAREVLAGEFGGYVASHGGRFEIVGVDHGALRVRLAGACSGCPAAEISLRAGFESRVRQLCPSARVTLGPHRVDETDHQRLRGSSSATRKAVAAFKIAMSSCSRRFST